MTGDNENTAVQVTCKNLYVTYKPNGGALGVVHEKRITHTIDGSISCTISIAQGVEREIAISADKEVPADTLFDLCESVEKLLMIFDGKFIPVVSAVLSESERFNDEDLKSCSKEYIENRLGLYASADFCCNNCNKLIEFQNALTDVVFDEWLKIEKSLDISLTAMFYALSSGVPRDIGCAFMVEMAKPMAEMVNDKLEESGTSLKMLLKALISKYGKEIFKSEIDSKKDYIPVLVESRNRIMHIKSNQNKLVLDGGECILYSWKLFTLYRVIIFELLGIDKDLYIPKMKKHIECLDSWENVKDNFTSRINQKAGGQHE